MTASKGADPCALIGFSDDATGGPTPWYCAPSETTAAYREVWRRHLARYGRPVARYADRHGIFRINREDPANGHTRTLCGRCLAGREIEAIHAHMPAGQGAGGAGQPDPPGPPGEGVATARHQRHR